MLLAHRRYSSGSQWGLWRWTDVVIGGELYLRRLHLLQTPWFAVMLHWIFRADPQPDMHDHPVSFLSIMLRGWYWEERRPHPLAVVIRLHVVAWWNRLRTTDQHRILYVPPAGCLTLCIAGPKRRDWGFHASRGWVPWREYRG